MLLNEVKRLLLMGELEEAADTLVSSIYSTDSLHAWSTISKNSSPLHHSLSFVSSISFDKKVRTAFIDVDILSMVIGVDFFLGLEDMSELFFVLLHERGHVLIDMVHGSWTDSFGSFRFGNMWEDQYINDSVGVLINSNLCNRLYKDVRSRFRDLYQQNFSLWFSKNYDWLKFHLPPHLFSSLHKTHLDGSPISLSIPYTTWMKIGLVLERYTEEKEHTGDFLEVLAGKGRTEEDEEGDKGSGDEGAPSEEEASGTLASKRGSLSTHYQPGETSSSLAKILKSFTVDTVPADCSNLLKSLEFRNSLEEFVSSSLVGEVISTFGSDNVIIGRTGSLSSSLHRRDVFQLASGIMPLSWTIELPVEQRKLKLYFDVSGSMSSYYPLVFFVHRYLSDYVDEHFQFSTEVVSVDPEGTSLVTTGGTSYDAVASHILTHGHRDVIVVTDNTDNLSKDLRFALKDSLHSLYLLQTEKGHFHKYGFNSLATSVLDLPE